MVIVDSGISPWGLTLLGRGYVFSQFATLSELAGCAGLLVSAVLALRWQKEGRYFYRLFAPLYLIPLFLAVTGAVIYDFFHQNGDKRFFFSCKRAFKTVFIAFSFGSGPLWHL
ncbi:MAG: hypothetical protein K2P13_03555 [Lachnospiraceae bacterium]|nr:hypothetical protein [Lachnospiraceae bacterium]